MGIRPRRLFLWSPESRNQRSRLWHCRPHICHSQRIRLHSQVHVSLFMRPSITGTQVVLVGLIMRLESVWWFSRPWWIVLADRLKIARRYWPAVWTLRVPPGHRGWQSSRSSERPRLESLRASRSRDGHGIPKCSPCPSVVFNAARSVRLFPCFFWVESTYVCHTDRLNS